MFKLFNHSRNFPPLHTCLHPICQAEKKNTYLLNNEPTTSLRLEWSCPTSAEMSRRGLPIPRMTAMLTDDGTMLTTSDTGGKSEARRKNLWAQQRWHKQPPWQRTTDSPTVGFWIVNEKTDAKRHLSLENHVLLDQIYSSKTLYDFLLCVCDSFSSFKWLTFHDFVGCCWLNIQPTSGRAAGLRRASQAQREIRQMETS